MQYPNGQPDKGTRRCPHGEHAKMKPGMGEVKPNGCGIGFFAGIIPGSGKFGQCCLEHDICFGKDVFVGVSRDEKKLPHRCPPSLPSILPDHDAD